MENRQRPKLELRPVGQANVQAAAGYLPSSFSSSMPRAIYNRPVSEQRISQTGRSLGTVGCEGDFFAQLHRQRRRLADASMVPRAYGQHSTHTVRSRPKHSVVSRLLHLNSTTIPAKPGNLPQMKAAPLPPVAHAFSIESIVQGTKIWR